VRTKLSYKIFAAFLLTFFVVLALMILSIRFFAYQNFSDYVHKVEIEMLDEFIDRLTAEYEKHQSWHSMRGNFRLWYATLRLSNLGKKKTEEEETISLPASGFMVSEHAMGTKNPLTWPFRDDDLETEQAHFKYVYRMLHRLTLFDEFKTPLVGRSRSAEGHVLRGIDVDGKTVGWLGLRKHERLSHPLDVAYMKEQFDVFYLAGGAMLFLAAVVSYFLSRNLLAPVKQLTAGTRALTSLKFDTRIDVRSKDELGQLAADFNVMANTLEKSKQMRQQWITDISHELRTPLSILRGEIEAMQDGVRQTNRHNLDSLHSEVLYLSKIVNDLHDLSLAETGNLPLSKKKIDPVRAFKETVRIFETRFAQHQITVLDELGSDRKAVFYGDADRLTQLFSNLFENVLRYADSPGTLRLWKVEEKGRLMLHVEDSGPGVPEESVERLFDRLYRVDHARTRARGGSGLGLSICKSIVEAHGGRIKAQNAPSGGLRFDIELPIVSHQSAEKQEHDDEI
jgi:two-component system, OmpR family, sensor histidine kinase BaeS